MLNKITSKIYRHLKNIILTAWVNYLHRKKVDDYYKLAHSLGVKKSNEVILLDGLWDNPNHFFRLSIFLNAIDVERQCKRVAVVRENTSSAILGTLQSLGVVDFLIIPDDVAAKFIDAADNMLLNVKTHEDFLRIQLPHELPAYVIYDYVLKKMRHPHPPIEDPCWRNAVAYALMIEDCLSNFFSAERVVCVVLSHPWGLPYGSIVWSAIDKLIKTYHLTGYGEGIRIRLFKSKSDFSLPVEHLSYIDYKELPDNLKTNLSRIGKFEFDKRISGLSSDINARYAFKPKDRQCVDQIKAKLGIGGDVTVVLVCSHVWFDYPHTFGMRNFVDFYDWISFTLESIKDLEGVTWLMKPHPTETWYGGFQLSSMLIGEYSNIILLPQDFDQATAISLADAVVTVHGTVGLEAAINNLPVICADRSYYSDWPFTYFARSRDEYKSLLLNILEVCASQIDNKDSAAACFAAALSHPNETDQRMKLRCDSMSAELYKDIYRFHRLSPEICINESKLISEWLSSGTSSYAVYTLLKGLSSPYTQK